MKRANRLRSRLDFEQARASRRSWVGPLLVLYVAANNLRRTRLGVTVGKRVGNAVVRNRVRRRVREAVRLRYPELQSGRDLLFVARPAAAQAAWTEVRGATEELLRRSRALGAAAPSDQGGVEASSYA